MPVTYTVSDGDVLEVTAFCSYQGVTVIHVFHYVVREAAPDTDGNQLVLDYLNRWKTVVWSSLPDGLQNRVNSNFQLQRLRGQIVNPTRHYFNEIVVNEFGNNAVPGNPVDTDLVVDFRTNEIGRGKTGRKFFTGLFQNQINASQWAAGALVNWQATGELMNFNILRNIPILTDFVTPIIWSRKRPLDRRAIVAVACLPDIRVLRRRVPGVGI